MDLYYKMVVLIVFAPLYLGSNIGKKGMEGDLEYKRSAERVETKIESERNSV